MPIESSITEQMNDGLRIERFIYHLIRSGEEEPHYYDEVRLNPDQTRFFEEQIRSATSGTQFSFTSPDNNTFKENCISLTQNDEFIHISKSLSARFLEMHDGRSNDGVFIVSIISVPKNNGRQNLVALLKVDFSTVYSQKIKEDHGKTVVELSKVVDSLSDNKSSIQKWAIVDPGDFFAWDVIALQRGKGKAKENTEEAISDYFRGFLQVSIRENASTLTKKAMGGITAWADSLEDRPDDLPVLDYKTRAVSYLETTAQFNTNDYAERVLGRYWDEDEDDQALIAERQELRERHKTSLINNLYERSVGGQVFEPKPNSITRTDKRNTITTHQGIKIIYQGSQEDNNIEVIHSPDGTTKITITSSHVEFE